MPVRIQRKRTKGWRMPEGAKYVGRPTRFGNPFEVVDVLDAFGGDKVAARLDCVSSYRRWLEVDPEGQSIARLARILLRGDDLACFCPLDQPCHADVLLELANK